VTARHNNLIGIIIMDHCIFVYFAVTHNQASASLIDIPPLFLKCVIMLFTLFYLIIPTNIEHR